MSFRTQLQIRARFRPAKVGATVAERKADPTDCYLSEPKYSGAVGGRTGANTSGSGFFEEEKTAGVDAGVDAGEEGYEEVCKPKVVGVQFYLFGCFGIKWVKKKAICVTNLLRLTRENNITDV